MKKTVNKEQSQYLIPMTMMLFTNLFALVYVGLLGAFTDRFEAGVS